MKPYYADDAVTVWHGDCLDVMRGMPDGSVHAVVTDPPYLLGFMGRQWDTLAAHRHLDWHAAWVAECFRLLAPGGHLLAFGGSRTWHRLAVAVEDAGFEIRDSIAWLYGSGFPKSLDVSKAIDKAAGAQREVVGDKLDRPGYHLNGHNSGTGALGQGISSTTAETRLAAALITAPATPDAARWQGWGTALKPAFEPIVVARKPLRGTVAANVLAHGTGALNVDATRVATDDNLGGGANKGMTSSTRHEGFARPWMDDDEAREAAASRSRANTARAESLGRWPANVVLDEHAAAELDRQSGGLTSGVLAAHHQRAPKEAGIRGSVEGERGYGDSGGASRFFPVFKYEAKAPTAERPRVANKGARDEFLDTVVKRCTKCGKQRVNMPGSFCVCAEPDFQPDPKRSGHVAHPTVKPLDLMRWLVRLVTPPGGVVLDPFAGSGTTAEACLIEGFRCITVEREAEYLPLIAARLSKPIEPVLDLGGLGA